MILNKVSVLLEKNAGSFCKMQSQTEEIKELKIKWNEKMAAKGHIWSEGCVKFES